jgi:hypothetical protein
VITRTRLDTLKHDHDMIVSFLHLGLVFYISLGTTETRVFIPSPFNNFLKGAPHPDEAWRERSCDQP